MKAPSFLDSRDDFPEIEAQKELGIKAVNLKKLIEIKESCEAEFCVPQGFVIPASGCQQGDFRAAFNLLTEDISESHLLAVRSSTEDELPGVHTSLLITFDPADKEESFKKCVEAYEKVVGDLPKGVIVQRHASTKDNYRCPYSYSREDRIVHGQEDRSFVAHSHSDWNPDLIQISVARGLTHAIVNDSDDSYVLDIDRETEEVKMVLWLSHYSYNYRRLGSDNARQSRVYFADNATGKIDYDRVGNPPFYRVHQGEHDSYMTGKPRTPLHSSMERRIEDNSLESLQEADFELTQILKVTKELALHWGTPIEIEGNITGEDDHAVLNVFQIRPLEQRETEDIALSEVPPERLIMRTNKVIGSGVIRGSLVLKNFHSHVNVNTFAHGETINRILPTIENPILLTPQGLGSHFWNEMPDIEGRLSFYPENMQSHSMGFTRSKMDRGEKGIYASLFDEWEYPQVQVDELLATKLAPEHATSEHAGGYIYVFENVVLESNGQECQLFFTSCTQPTKDTHQEQEGTQS